MKYLRLFCIILGIKVRPLHSTLLPDCTAWDRPSRTLDPSQLPVGGAVSFLTISEPSNLTAKQEDEIKATSTSNLSTEGSFLVKKRDGSFEPANKDKVMNALVNFAR
jgi:hypothetical protein